MFHHDDENKYFILSYHNNLSYELHVVCYVFARTDMDVSIVSNLLYCDTTGLGLLVPNEMYLCRAN